MLCQLQLLLSTCQKCYEMSLFCSHVFCRTVRGTYSSFSAPGSQRSSGRWERCRCLPLKTSLSPCSESRTPLGGVEEAFCQAQSAPPSQEKWWHDSKCRLPQTRREGETGSGLYWCADIRASVSCGNLEFANCKHVSARLKTVFLHDCYLCRSELPLCCVYHKHKCRQQFKCLFLAKTYREHSYSKVTWTQHFDLCLS